LVGKLSRAIVGGAQEVGHLTLSIPRVSQKDENLLDGSITPFFVSDTPRVYPN